MTFTMCSSHLVSTKKTRIDVEIIYSEMINTAEEVLDALLLQESSEIWLQR